LEDFLAWLTALVSFGLLLGIFEEGGLERNVGSMWAPTKTHREMLAEIGGKNQTEIGREREGQDGLNIRQTLLKMLSSKGVIAF